jgi:predicted MPP superfamily phosphohydrolase
MSRKQAESSMPPLKILHLTDLHLRSSPNWDQELLNKRLIEDLRGLDSRGQKPEFLFFTGDLAQAGGAKDAYAPVSAYLKSIQDVASIRSDSLFLCPGNHDVDRDLISKHVDDLKRWRSAAASPDSSNSLSQDDGFNAYLANAFSAYNKFADQMMDGPPLYSDHYVKSFRPLVSAYNIVIINTATLSAGGALPELDDRGRLFIPEQSLENAFDSLSDNSATLILGHHPFSWMNDFTQGLISRIIPSRGIAYFCGHMHDAVPSSSLFLSGSLMTAQSGALYSSRKYWNGYAIFALSGAAGDARISYRRWFEGRRSFAKAEDLGDDGTFYTLPDSISDWLERDGKITPAQLDAWRTTQLFPELTKECQDSFVGEKRDVIFLKPEFDYEVPYTTEKDGHVGSKLELIDFDELLQSDENIVISAGAETGKSTLLKQIALSFAGKQVTRLDWTFPALINFSSISAASGSVEKAIRRNLPDLPNDLTVKGLLNSGSMIVLIDDVDFSQRTKRQVLVRFLETYPACRFIITSSTPFVESSALRPEISPEVSFRRMRMRPIRPSQLLSIIEGNGTTDPLEADRMLARVVRDAHALNVPLTAVTGTFLIQIFQDDPDHVMLNQASLTERYVEILLQKFAPRDLLPGTFDYRNKVDLLSSLAELMSRADEYAPHYDTVLQWFILYLKNYGLAFSASDLLNYFIEARILERAGDNVRFRLKMFFEFFAATRMMESAEFRDFVLDDERYTSFINEIGFYAALNRKDGPLVEQIYRRLYDYAQADWDDIKIPDPEKFVQDFIVSGNSTTESELDDIYRSVQSDDELILAQKRLREGVDLVSNDSNQVIDRIRHETVSEKWFAHLILLSALVKHMELINDRDKRRYLAGALDGWVQFMANSLALVNPLAKERRVAFNGVTYVSTLPDSVPIGEVARRLALSMPIAASRMATAFMGTDKLLTQFAEGVGSIDEPLGRQLMRVSIIADLGAGGVAALASKASDQMRGKRFLTHVLARKLYEVAVRFRLDRDELNAVRSKAADLYVALEGTPGGQIASRRATIIAGMETQRRQIEVFGERQLSGRLEGSTAKPKRSKAGAKRARGRRRGKS